jgi:TolA-binding protein
MSTRKRVKKNIKEDQLVTWAVRMSRWTQEHFNQVIVGVVVLVAVIAVSVFMANSRQGSSREAVLQMSSALNLYQSADYESARASFEQISARYGGQDAAMALFFIGECHLRQGRHADGLAAYDRYLATYKDYPTFRASAIYAKALCYEGLENYPDAASTMVALLDVVDEKDPRYVDGAFQAGEFFARAGNTEQAATYFRIVADKGTGDLKERAAVAAALLGQ